MNPKENMFFEKKNIQITAISLGQLNDPIKKYIL